MQSLNQGKRQLLKQASRKTPSACVFICGRAINQWIINILAEQNLFKMILTLLLFGVLALIFGYAAFQIYRTSKKIKLAKWARKNKTQARWILVAFNLAMALTGICIGLLLTKLNIQINQYAIYLGLAIFVLGTFLFPSNDKSSPDIAGRYRKKQLLSALRVLGSSLALIAFANGYFGETEQILVNQSSAGPVLLIILASLGLVAFGFGILVLSCGIACNGYEAVALMVLVGGSGGLITLYVFVLRKIIKNSKKRRNPMLNYEPQPDLLDDNF